ncbi:MAG: YlbF family regulator [Clostridia bacterium]|jgi:cell fate (sporulation/competence/biofilm development) regulator YlbF (YheA/YmcA/DUF963 family)|nr:YlbF family regulator [Clostridia bacterium]
MLFEKAKEVGELLVESNEYKSLREAKDNFMANEAAMKEMDDYQNFQEDIQARMMNGELEEEAFKAEVEKLKDMGLKLKENKAINDLVNAESDFNDILNQVLAVIRATIGGDELEEGCGHDHGHDHGDCGGCSGGCCH